MDLIEELQAVLGPANVLTGTDTNRYAVDWTHRYASDPLAVVRPASTAEVSAVMELASAARTPVVPVSGNTGLAGGTRAQQALMLSMERMNRIEEIRVTSRVAIVEAGVVLATLHEACAEQGLAFPVIFGARGSAMIGGILATNAGGSNVVRYGNTRAQCLGIEVVLADGRVLNLMSELHKDNSGYDLRDLFVGSEGTLGVITRAVLKLTEEPRARATAMVAVRGLPDALELLNALQSASGGAVEAFEYMPGSYIRQHMAKFPAARAPFADLHEVNLLVELTSTAPRDAMSDDGSQPLTGLLEATLAQAMEDGRVLDAAIAMNEAQRREMWDRREQAAEVALTRLPLINNDVALPLDRVENFLARMAQILPEMDPGAETNIVAHLGDGNVHYNVWPSADDAALNDRIVQRLEGVVADLGGSFSAEHGIGVSKKPSMRRRKDPVALDVMARIKRALDPSDLMNPGKVLPD